MAEIKLNDGFRAEVEAFRSAGAGSCTEGINSVSAEGLSLPTVNAYQERMFGIWKVMLRFQALTRKDAQDMEALAERIRAVDMGMGGR